MVRALTRVRGSLTFLAILSISSSCSSDRRADVTPVKSTLTTGNGLFQNGLTTNGLFQNGLFQNGLFQNGLFQNGLFQNGLFQNGLFQNGAWVNGLFQNGLFQNGLFQNGLFQNGVWQEGLTGNDAVPGDTLRHSAYLRQLLQYIYSCGMPSSYTATLDPNGITPLSCVSDADCDVGYSCSSSACVIPLQGMGANDSGLGINDDLTTWWGQPAPGGSPDLSTGKWGKCDETCQRWVSACVLARTNAYGVHVPISLRAPADAPPPIQKALEVDETAGGESDTFTLREGVYYGNIFATTPVNPAPSSTYSGPTDGPIAYTPQYFACAGPGSNIPAVTKRFCSSQGDQAVIKVPGVCVNNASQNGLCVNSLGNPANTLEEIANCSTGTMAPPLQPTSYSQLIKVYLQQPIAVCGNGVCEEGETAGCESDCHPGTWTKNYDPTFETLQTQIPPLGDTFPNFMDYAMAALGPDDSVVVAGDTTEPFDLDGTALPYDSTISNAGILVKYKADGSYAWADHGVRFDLGGLTVGGFLGVSGITVTSTGDIKVVGVKNGVVWMVTFDSDGNLIARRVLASGSTMSAGRSVSVDSLGNTYIAGYLNGAATFSTSPTKQLTGSDGHSIFLMKVSPTGAVPYAEIIDGNRFVSSLSNDKSGNTLLTTLQASNTAAGPSLIKKCADPTLASCADGSNAWSVNFGTLGAFTAVAADASGNVYAAGYFASDTDFGHGPRHTTGTPPTLVKYDRNGAPLWDKQATIICPPAPNVCSFGSFVYPTTITFDTEKNVVLASWGTPSIGGGIDFGLGTLPTYATSNIFLSAYLPEASGSRPAGSPQWAKVIQGVLGINVRGIGLDSVGRVIVSGTFGGSLVVDDVMLATNFPVDTFTVNPFIASFGGPPPGDLQAPDIGHTIDQAGNAIYTVPQNIYAQATSSKGAQVFYMLPTAIDDAHAGTSVVCWPPPNSTFPITTTTVNCTASDPRGNDSIASFTVTVVDKIGPVFTPVHDITLPAIDATGATVTYTPPTAKDQVSGNRAVTCTPLPGSLFSVGHHTVTCSATDAKGNTSTVSFSVDVTGAGGIGDPCLSTTDCSSGTCVDGVCCMTTSCGSCQACNTAGAMGTCAATSGGACDDGNACTQTDTCQAGTCTGSNPVTCAESDQCHVAGTCNPTTGVCSNPAAANGTACSDGNACTQTDTCQAGTCTGTNPVTCGGSDQCHAAGTCDPSTGACSNPAAPDGTTCSDGNACTAGDACMSGSCVGGGAASCDDQNPCTVDSCNAVSGCAHTPGNAGVVCRAAANACDSAEVCTGSSATCPAGTDKLPPNLGPGTNQTVVGNCPGSGVVFAVPPLASSACETGTNVTCTWTQGSSHGTCAKSGTGATLPGNRYGAYTISCTAKDAAGNVSPAVVFTVTVLQPLTIRIQPPLSGDNNSVDNIVKLGSTVPNKVRLYACGTDVTRTASVVVKIGTALMSSGGSTRMQTLATYTDTPDTGGVMILDGSNYRYNLSTKGLSATSGVAAFYQENITAAYKSAPSVVVGTDTIQIDLK
jgi:hypothetical protein